MPFTWRIKVRPTLRARVGDLIEVAFANRIDTKSFANSLDQEDVSDTNTTGCDEARTDIHFQRSRRSSAGVKRTARPRAVLSRQSNAPRSVFRMV